MHTLMKMGVLSNASSHLLMASIAILFLASSNVGSLSTNNSYVDSFQTPPPAKSPTSYSKTVLPPATDDISQPVHPHYNNSSSPPLLLNFHIHNHSNSFLVEGKINPHESYDGEGATVKVTCIAAGDKQIFSYGKTTINGTYSISVEGYDYAKYGIIGCKAKLIYLVPKASPFKNPIDVYNAKTGAELEDKCEYYINEEDILFESKPFDNQDENLTLLNPQMPVNHPQQTAIVYYKLTLQWANGVCKGQSGILCHQPWPHHFTLHGLWPFHTTGASSGLFIPYDRYNIRQALINDGINVTQLEIYWPNLSARFSNDKFWSCEWNKHGPKSDMTLFEYFQTTLDWYIDVSSRIRNLKSSLISYRGSGPYSLRDIQQALYHSYGFKCKVVCVADRKYPYRFQRIQEIRFSFSWDFYGTTNTYSKHNITGSNCDPRPILFP